MKRNLSVLILSLSCALLCHAADSDRIRIGDRLEKVYQELGKPVVEYPLNGTFVQEYRRCTVISSNDAVVSVTYNEAMQDEEEKPTTPMPNMNIEDIKELAKNGDSEAQYILAYCFQMGKQIDQNPQAAVAWYTRAAMQNHVAAQHNLGYMYMNGRGVDRDLKQAYMWALITSENGNDILRKAIVHRLDEDDKRSAEMLAEHLRLEMQSLRLDQKPSS